MTDLLMMIDNKSVKLLQTEFARDKLIGREKFIQVMLDHVGGSGATSGTAVRRKSKNGMGQSEEDFESHGDALGRDRLAPEAVMSYSEEWVVEQAIELFQMIDANGDGVLEWGEFSAFIIELNKTHDLEKEANEAEDLRLGKVVSFRNKFNIQRRTVFFQACDWTDAMLTVEERSDQLRVHTFDGELAKNAASVRVSSSFVPHQVITGCLLAGCDQAAVSTQCRNQFFLTIHDIGKQVARQTEQCQTLSGQRLMKWHPQSKILATTGTGRGDAKGFVISIYERNARAETQLGSTKHRLVWHHKLITCLEFLTHQHLVAGSKDGTVSIWDLETGAPISMLNIHETGVLSLSSRSLVPKNEEQWSSFWVRAIKETKVATLVSCPNPQYGDKLTDPDLSCAVVHTISDFHKNIQETTQLIGHRSPTRFVKLVPESGYIITCDSSGECRLWNPSAEFACVQSFFLGCSSFVWTRKWLVTTAFAHGRDQVFEIAPAKKQRTPLLFCVFSATMACFVTATKWEVAIWEAKSSKRVTVIQTCSNNSDDNTRNEGGGREITACCLDDRERKIIVGFDSGELEVYNLFNGSLIKVLDPHPREKPVTAVFFCHEGTDRLVISTSWAGYIHICDEDDRVGHVPGKRSVKLRSIHLRDKHNGTYDITSSAFCFHLKQIATFSQRKQNSAQSMASLNLDLGPCIGKKKENQQAEEQGKTQVRGEEGKDDGETEKEGSEEPETNDDIAEQQQEEEQQHTMICVWDLEFARLQGTLEGDDNAHYEELRYAGGKVPILLGLDSTHNCVAVWCTVQGQAYPGFSRLQTISIDGMGHLTALETMLGPLRNKRQRMYFFVGDDKGCLKRFKIDRLHKTIPQLEDGVRSNTYRGNRQTHNRVFVENLVRKSGTRPACESPKNDDGCFVAAASNADAEFPASYKATEQDTKELNKLVDESDKDQFPQVDTARVDENDTSGGDETFLTAAIPRMPTDPELDQVESPPWSPQIGDESFNVVPFLQGEGAKNRFHPGHEMWRATHYCSGEQQSNESAHYDQSSAIEVLTLFKEDGLLFVGYGDGAFDVVSTTDGSLGATIDVLSDRSLPEVKGLDILRLQQQRDDQVHSILPAVRNARRQGSKPHSRSSAGDSIENQNREAMEGSSADSTCGELDQPKQQDILQNAANVLFERLRLMRQANEQSLSTLTAVSSAPALERYTEQVPESNQLELPSVVEANRAPTASGSKKNKKGSITKASRMRLDKQTKSMTRLSALPPSRQASAKEKSALRHERDAATR